MPPPPPAAPPPPPTLPPGVTLVEANATQYTISLTVEGSVDTFNSTSFEANLRDYLPCYEPDCTVVLQVTAASVNVEAEVTDTTSISTENATALETMSTTEVGDALGVGLYHRQIHSNALGSADVSRGARTNGRWFLRISDILTDMMDFGTSKT